MKSRSRDRVEEIFKKVNVEKLPFKINPEKLNELGVDIAEELSDVFSEINKCSALKWCLSTVKKAKVFTLIYQANELGLPIYKEEIYIKFGSHSVKIDNNNCIDLIKNEKVEEKFKYIIFELDSRLLKWLLNGPRYAHWNNAEIGSHIKYYRKPNAYSRNLHASICYLHC